MEEMKEIEATLGKLNLGISEELSGYIETTELETEVDDNGRVLGDFYHGWSLGYGRDARNNWCLIVRKYRVSGDRPARTLEDQDPLLQTSRDLRIAAAERVPELLIRN
jgi:hypothetical protein